MMCVGAIGIATVTWALVGYSLAFDGSGGFVGGLAHGSFTGSASRPAPEPHIPQLLFMAFEATFCIITIGAGLRRSGRADELRAFLVFAALWSVLVLPCSPTGSLGGGWLAGSTASLDFAGGVPVEMGSGFSALAAALVVGRARTTGARRCCPTTPSTCCSAPGCSGSAGSASTAAVATPPATRACWPSSTRSSRRPARWSSGSCSTCSRPARHRDRRGDGDHRRLRRRSPRPPATSAPPRRCCWGRWRRYLATP